MLLALVLASLTSHPAAFSVRPIELAALANHADAIVVGRVASVVCIGHDGITDAKAAPGEAARCASGRTIAEVEVERVLRGDPHSRRLWYLAEGTWTCDVAQAIPGERALFFLALSTPVFESGPEADLASTHTGGQPILHDAYSGRGRMPLRTIEGEEWLTAWDDVIPPTALEKREATWQGEYAIIYWSARLDAVARFVENSLRTREHPLPAHPVSGVPARAAVFGETGQVVAALWGDGTAVWSEGHQLGGPPYLRGEVAPGVLSEIGQWCRERELPTELSAETLPPARVSLRYGALVDLALDAGASPEARELRDRVVKGMPEDGTPLPVGAPVVR